MIHRSQGQSILGLLFLSAVTATLALLPTQVRAAPLTVVPESLTIPTVAAIGGDRPIAEALQVGVFASGYRAVGDAPPTPTFLPTRTPTPASPGETGTPVLWWIFPPAALLVAVYYLLRLMVRRLAARSSRQGRRGS